jgi:hypothetical protein
VAKIWELRFSCGLGNPPILDEIALNGIIRTDCRSGRLRIIFVGI